MTTAETSAKPSTVEWILFVLLTALLSVVGAYATVMIAALGAMGAMPGDPYLDQVWGMAMFGWIGAIVTALVGAVVGVCTRRSIWCGYPFSVGIYLFAMFLVLTMENT